MKLEVRNPRTGEIDHWLEPAQPSHVASAAERLRAVQPAWEAEGPQGRAHVLSEWAFQIAETRAEIVAALIHDTGRLAESELEIDGVLRMIDRWSRLSQDLLHPEKRAASSMPGIGVEQGSRAYRVAGVISPWNFPLLLSLIDAIPALAAGCAVIVKPSEVAPRFIEPLARTIAATHGLPLAIVPGAAHTGEALINNVDAVCFTGSVPTGRGVAEQAARRFIPAFLELGGKDPAIVLAGTDLDRASSALVWGSTANAGQACQSIERIYADRSIAGGLVERLVAKASALRLAVPQPADGEIGPIIAADQIEIIAEHLSDAAARGAVTRTGGTIEVHDGGSYCLPTVLTGVDHSMKVMTQETFGPIMPVMEFDGADEAIALANDTTYGLSAAVFAGSEDEALRLAKTIDAGAVSVNDAALTAFVSDGEKNSFNFSGLGGSRMGPASLRRFLRRQAYLIAESADPDPWWPPPLKKR
ncbi:MAG: aldehyde dehydrogenase family protein [Actinomycetota bacterium]